jgi:hypothetical protein
MSKMPSALPRGATPKSSCRPAQRRNPSRCTGRSWHRTPAWQSDATACLLAEGTVPLVDAARQAGLDPTPSLRTLLRAAAAGPLETLLIAGRRVPSPTAIVRWIAAEQRRLEAAR